MAEWTKEQLQQMDALVAGSHDRLDPNVRYQPGYSLSDIYAGIYPPAKPTPTFQVGMMGRGLPTSLPKLTTAGLGDARLPSGWPWQPGAEKLDGAGIPINQPSVLAGMFGRAPSALDRALQPTATFDDLLAYAQSLPSKKPVAAVAQIAKAAPPKPLVPSLSAMFAPSAPTPRITGPGGGGAFVSSDAASGSPAASIFESGTLLPASMNNDRWTGLGY